MAHVIRVLSLFSLVVVVATGRARRSTPCSTQALTWVHTPKTGSSFAMALASDCCPKEVAAIPYNPKLIYLHQGDAHIKGLSTNCKSNKVGHGPLSLATRDQIAVIVLREPRRRLASSFLDHEHSEGQSPAYRKGVQEAEGRAVADACGTSRKARVEAASRYSPEAPCDVLAKAQVYLNDPANHGCVVKTLNGVPCYKENVTITPHMLTVAKLRIQSFYFIGLFELWDETVFAFHHLRRSNVSAFELVPTRTQSRHSTEDYLVERLDYDDPYDAELYAEGKRLFHEKWGALVPEFRRRIDLLRASVVNASTSSETSSSLDYQNASTIDLMPPARRTSSDSSVRLVEGKRKRRRHLRSRRALDDTTSHDGSLDYGRLLSLRRRRRRRLWGRRFLSPSEKQTH